MRIKIVSIVVSIVLLASFWIVIPVYAEDTLTIEYPSTMQSEDFFVMEGEEFMIKVSANGIPLYGATVTFEELSNYTNDFGVGFAYAPVGDTGKKSLSVGKDGYENLVTNVGVRSAGSAAPDEQLVIDIPEYIRSGEGLIVSVTTAEGSPVDGAEILVEWDDEIMYTTEGSTWFVTPSVDAVQTYSIQACKEGYYHDMTHILIYPAGTTELVIETPSYTIYEEGNIQINVTDGEEELDGVEVTVEWNDETYITEDGSVTIQAPLIDETTDFIIQASLDGYIPSTASITIVDVIYWLEMSAPYEITEGGGFEVSVWGDSSGAAAPLLTHGITVLFDGENYPVENGVVNLIAPMVDEDSEYQIIASHPDYTSAQHTILVKDTDMPTLVIDRPSSVNENESFIVYIASDGNPIENALVTFNEESLLTDQDGQVEFTTPPVDQNQNFEITASKEGYHSETASILVVNLVLEGWIYGMVTNSFGEPIDDVEICALLSNEEEYDCTFTLVDGTYNLSVDPGTYTVEASKEGYSTSIVDNVVVLENGSTEVYFILENENEEIINEAIKNGNIGAKISFQEDRGQLWTEQIVYTDITISSKMDEKNKEITLIVMSENVTGKTIMFSLPKTLFKMDWIVIKYDGIQINKANNLSDVLNSSDDGPDSEFYVIESENNAFLMFVSIPFFSEHTITIASIVEAVGGITMVIMYIAIIAIVGILYVVPIIYFQKK